jgi:hypothetical protein
MERQRDKLQTEGDLLYVELAAMPLDAEFVARRNRRVGVALGNCGLGLTITTNLREMIIRDFETLAGGQAFCDAFRRRVLAEKRLWHEFRLGIRPVLLGVN